MASGFSVSRYCAHKQRLLTDQSFSDHVTFLLHQCAWIMNDILCMQARSLAVDHVVSKDGY